MPKFVVRSRVGHQVFESEWFTLEMAVWRFNQACTWDEATVSLTRISDGRIIRKRG
jgi:hypothetical protein